MNRGPLQESSKFNETESRDCGFFLQNDPLSSSLFDGQLSFLNRGEEDFFNIREALTAFTDHEAGDFEVIAHQSATESAFKREVIPNDEKNQGASLIFNPDILASALDVEQHKAIAVPARERIDRLLLSDLAEDNVEGNATLSQQLERDFFKLAAQYEAVTSKLSPDGKPPRNAADVIAWIEGSRGAVFPLPLEGYNVLTEEQYKIARIFFYTSVFFDIAVEEKEETLRQTNRTEAGIFTRQLAHRRIIDKDDFELETDSAFLELTEEERDYARMLDHSISLLDRCVKALCDVEKLDDTEHRQQLQQIQAAMDLDRDNLLGMMDFGRQFDEFIRGQREELTGFFTTPGGGQMTTLNRLPTTKEFNNAAQLNIFLRYMLLGNFKMLWGALPAEKREKFNFDTLLSQMIRIGQKIDSLGNRSNDTSLWKEVEEGTAVNTNVVEGMNDPDPVNRVSKEEFLSSHIALTEMNPASARKLIGQVVEAYFNGEYESVSPQLKAEYPGSPVIGLMDKLLKNGGPYSRMLDLWEQEYQSLKDPAQISEVSKLYDTEALCQAQYLVLMRYMASVLQKMKI